MNELWDVYHNEIPEFIAEFADTPPLLRLKEVGMNCGCEYTDFPLFRGLQPYSRYDHSVGAALIVWHFTESVEQSLAALFHDVTTPTFAHAVDFLNGDHLLQESTEAGVAECLSASTEVCSLLGKYGIALDDVADYHRYPIADNSSPALSADRLEYTMGNLLNYGFADMEEIRGMYCDLVAGTDEAGQPEIVFRTPDKAAEFTRLALNNSRVYVADEDRFAMEALAHILRRALEKGILTRGELMTTEPQVIAKLKADAECDAAWEEFCGYSKILRSETKGTHGLWVSVNAKKRYIDPLAEGRGRVSAWDTAAAAGIADFLRTDFSCWLSAEWFIHDRLHYINEPEAKIEVYTHLSQAMDDIKLGRVEAADSVFEDILSELESLEV